MSEIPPVVFQPVVLIATRSGKCLLADKSEDYV